MYKLCLCVFLTGLSLFGQGAGNPQAVARLAPALSKVLVSAETADDSVNRALVEAMTSIANGEQKPTRQDLNQLAEALRGAMPGKAIGDAQITVLSRCIADALKGQSSSNLLLASQLQATLGAMHVKDAKTELILGRFMTVREAVRGPDDSPLSPKPIAKQ